MNAAEASRMCDAAAEAKSRTEPLEDAVKDPHERLLQKVGLVEQELDAREAAAQMQETVVEVEARRRGLREFMRSYRQNLAENVRLSSSLFLELSLVVKGRE